MSAEVLITGRGTIGPCGAGSEGLRAALAAGTPMTTPIDRSAGLHLEDGARLAALVPDRDVSRWVPAAVARRMSFPSRLAAAAGRMALADAGLGVVEAESVGAEGGPGDARGGRARLGIYLATSFGSSLATETLLRQILLEGPLAAQPFSFSESVANSAAAQLAIAVGARGPNVTLTQREAGPILAVVRAAQAVREGRVDRALAGAVEEITPLLHALLDRFGALARAEGTRPEMPRPFDRQRGGFLAGEGATLIVLERGDAARSRGARALARVGWGGAAFDPTASASDWGDGHAPLAAALRAGLDASPGGAAGIGVIVSGASGARRGDRLEGLVLGSIWGAAPPPIVVPKAVVGEYGGGIIAPALLALEGAAFGKPAGFAHPDPESGMMPHAGETLETPARVLLTGLASGGAAAWLVLEKPS